MQPVLNACVYIVDDDAIVRDAMAAGAVGFATSTSPAHNGEGGYPMPSRLASDEEMMQLTLAMASHGRGVYMVTKGGQMPMAFLQSLSWKERIGETAQARFELYAWVSMPKHMLRPQGEFPSAGLIRRLAAAAFVALALYAGYQALVFSGLA